MLATRLEHRRSAVLQIMVCRLATRKYITCAADKDTGDVELAMWLHMPYQSRLTCPVPECVRTDMNDRAGKLRLLEHVGTHSSSELRYIQGLDTAKDTLDVPSNDKTTARIINDIPVPLKQRIGSRLHGFKSSSGYDARRQRGVVADVEEPMRPASSGVYDKTSESSAEIVGVPDTIN